MSIWIHEHILRHPEEVWASHRYCIFCTEKLELLHSEYDPPRDRDESGIQKYLFVCSVCGRWKADGRQRSDATWTGNLQDLYEKTAEIEITYGAVASLRELDLADVSMPISEVRSYLAAKYEKRFSLHPKIFEETVASVFRDLGYKAVVTAYSCDDGIDIILDRGGEVVGVQVKRYKNSIEVEQVRSLVGALILEGMTRGMFVTTSTFQRGVEGTANRLRTRGYPIELIDARRFFDALKLAQRASYRSFVDFPIQDCLKYLVRVHERETPVEPDFGANALVPMPADPQW